MRRDAEEKRIELIHAFDEPAPLHVGLVLLRARIAVHRIPVPALARDLRDAVSAGFQIFPERIDVARLGEAACDTDDGNRLRVPGRGEIRRRARRIGSGRFGLRRRWLRRSFARRILRRFARRFRYR